MVFWGNRRAINSMLIEEYMSIFSKQALEKARSQNRMSLKSSTVVGKFGNLTRRSLSKINFLNGQNSKQYTIFFDSYIAIQVLFIGVNQRHFSFTN
jgi:hypothetical protein